MSPKTPEQLTQIRRTSKEKIVLAALELFAKKGYASSSISQIAKQAGVAKGLIYNYFKSKEELLEAIIDLAIEQGGSLNEMLTIVEPKEKLRFALDHYFESLDKDFDQMKLFFALALQLDQFESQRIHDIVHNKYGAYLKLFEELLKQVEVENPKAEAAILMALLDGLGLQIILLKEDVPIKEIKTHLYQKYHLE